MFTFTMTQVQNNDLELDVASEGDAQAMETVLKLNLVYPDWVDKERFFVEGWGFYSIHQSDTNVFFVKAHPVLCKSFKTFAGMVEDVAKVSDSLSQSMHHGMGNGELPKTEEELKKAIENNLSGSVVRYSPIGDRDYSTVSSGLGFTWRDEREFMGDVLIDGGFVCHLYHPKEYTKYSTLALSCIQNGWQWADEKPEGWYQFRLENTIEWANALSTIVGSVIDIRHVFDLDSIELIQFAADAINKKLEWITRPKSEWFKSFEDEDDDDESEVMSDSDLLGETFLQKRNWRDFVTFDDDDE